MPVAYWDYIRQEIDFRYLDPFSNQDLMSQSWAFGTFLSQMSRGTNSLWLHHSLMPAADYLKAQPYPPCIVSTI